MGVRSTPCSSKPLKYNLMKPTNLVFAYKGKYFGFPIFKDDNNCLCLANGCFVRKSDCIKASELKKVYNP